MSSVDNTKLEAYDIISYDQGPYLGAPIVDPSSKALNPEEMIEEAARKREHRLIKNREAARECRRKKKEYIKCLENRVQVLETQNKQLIDELQKLKRTYDDSGSRILAVAAAVEQQQQQQQSQQAPPAQPSTMHHMNTMSSNHLQAIQLAMANQHPSHHTHPFS